MQPSGMSFERIRRAWEIPRADRALDGARQMGLVTMANSWDR